MIQCPKCAASLPDWAKTCQFCGGDTKSVARPVAAQKYQNPAFQAPQWVWGAYYAVCVYFILGGVGGIFDTIRMTHMKLLGEEMGWTLGSYVGILINAIVIIFGIALMLRVEAARGIVNFVCGMRIIFGVFKLAGALIGSLFVGPLGLLLALWIVLDIATAALMIYLIGETEKSAPNL